VMAELPPFQTLIDEHATEVMAVLRGAVGREGAEDAFQETFLAALRSYPSLREARNLRGWLVTIAHRKAIDVTRAAARRAVPVAELPENPATALDGPADLDLHNSLAALPHKQRQAVAYHYLAGLPYQEVAAIIGGTTDAARRAAADGIAKLRRSYPKTGDF
jgi:RNA polymerase sigma factor (sigma-70 family)